MNLQNVWKYATYTSNILHTLLILSIDAKTRAHTCTHTYIHTHPHWRLQTSINRVFKYCVYIKQQNSAKYTCTAYVVQECNFCLGRSQKQTLHIKVNTRKMTIPLNTISTPRGVMKLLFRVYARPKNITL